MHRRQHRVELERDADVAADQLAAQHPDDVANEGAHDDRLALRFAALEQRAQPPDDLAGALVVSDDVAQDLPQRLEVDRRRRREPERRLRIAQDRRQRLVELVGDRARQLAEHRDAREVRELVAVDLGIELGADRRGDVGRHAPHARWLAATVEADIAVRRDPAHFAVAADDAMAQRVVAAALASSADRRRDGGAIVGVDEIEPLRQIGHVFGSDAEDRTVRVVRPRPVALQVAHPQAHAGSGRGHAQQLLGAEQLGVDAATVAMLERERGHERCDDERERERSDDVPGVGFPDRRQACARGRRLCLRRPRGHERRSEPGGLPRTHAKTPSEERRHRRAFGPAGVRQDHHRQRGGHCAHRAATGSDCAHPTPQRHARRAFGHRRLTSSVWAAASQCC
jgi:hypothetical protein